MSQKEAPYNWTGKRHTVVAEHKPRFQQKNGELQCVEEIIGLVNRNQRWNCSLIRRQERAPPQPECRFAGSRVGRGTSRSPTSSPSSRQSRPRMPGSYAG